MKLFNVGVVGLGYLSADDCWKYGIKPSCHKGSWVSSLDRRRMTMMYCVFGDMNTVASTTGHWRKVVASRHGYRIQRITS